MHVGSKCGLANGLAAPGLSGTDGDRWGQMGIDMRLALCLCVWGGRSTGGEDPFIATQGLAFILWPTGSPEKGRNH